MIKFRHRKYKIVFLGLSLGLILVAGVLALNRWPISNSISANENPSKNATNNQITDTQTAESIARDTNADAIKAELKVPILMYHHVRDYDNPEDEVGINLSVPTSKFATQLDWISQHGYTPVNFDQIRANSIPEKPIILTFDDGYDNFYTNAYPELKKRSMTAVVFAIANSGKEGYLSNSQIAELANNGIEIGSHTLSHPDLTVVDPNRAENEITASKKTLEDITGREIKSFCYPAGKYSDDIINILKNAGYDLATTTKSGMSNFASPFELNRYRVNNDTNIKGYLE